MKLKEREKKPKIPIMIVIYSSRFLRTLGVVGAFRQKVRSTVLFPTNFLLDSITEGIIKVSGWGFASVWVGGYLRDEVFIGLKDMFTNRVVLKYIPVYWFYRLFIIL